MGSFSSKESHEHFVVSFDDENGSCVYFHLLRGQLEYSTSISKESVGLKKNLVGITKGVNIKTLFEICKEISKKTRLEPISTHLCEQWCFDLVQELVNQKFVDRFTISKGVLPTYQPDQGKIYIIKLNTSYPESMTTQSHTPVTYTT